MIERNNIIFRMFSIDLVCQFVLLRCTTILDVGVVNAGRPIHDKRIITPCVLQSLSDTHSSLGSHSNGILITIFFCTKSACHVNQ